ncbi:MAG: YtxH protein [Flavipsychrobacter sp.]|nr:YtxH protein [Flavipsychrobacter sp.]
MSTSKFFAGALVGLVAGLLLAPEKGEDLRNDIADSAEKWKKKLYKVTGQASTELSDLKAILEDEISGLNEDVRHRLLTILNETEDSAKKIKRNVASELG